MPGAMDQLKRLGMKGPIRPAPSVPQFSSSRYSPVTNWNDDPFSADVFEPAPSFQQKKKPPPRPPPPKVKTHPDVPNKPSHFNRKPTILSSIMSRKDKLTKSASASVHQQFATEFQNENMTKIFHKCNTHKSSTHTSTLIDLSSPPSSPTFTTQSSSDGVSVDSFGSDATSSTNHRTTGNQSQAESGFEDDFDLFLSNRKIVKEDTLDDFANFDPFSPPKPVLQKKPSIQKFNDQLLCNGKTVQPAVHTHNMPTIIRAKPARPKPPDNSALLKTLQVPAPLPMNLNMSKPIEKVKPVTDFYSSFGPAPSDWSNESTPSLPSDWSPEREASPPMPCVPPPPPPIIEESDLTDPIWLNDEAISPECLNGDLPFDSLSGRLERLASENYTSKSEIDKKVTVREDSCDVEEPHAVALYDYNSDHPDDLSFEANAKITLLRRLDAEWLYGRLQDGREGAFPANYVEIRVPLPDETLQPAPSIGTATALYDFAPSHTGDLRLRTGDTVRVVSKINDDWYQGECGASTGQFPASYVQFLSS